MKPEELVEFHELWKQQPITRQFLQILDKHIEKLAERIATDSMATKTVSDQELRQICVQLKTTRTLRQLVYDTPTFVKNIGA